MALNEPRQIPYDFHVVRIGDEVWLLDRSEHSYPCTSVPHYYAEPLYSVTPGDGLPYSEPGMFTVRDIEGEPRDIEPVPLDPDEQAPSTPRADAWDAAREEANTNHLI